MKELRQVLVEDGAALGLSFSGAELDLAEAHASRLLETNRSLNLTRIVEPAEVARRHFLESFVAAELWPAQEGLRVACVGSGGGFPGLAGRIRRPDVSLTLLEPRTRKAAFLGRVAMALPGPPVQVAARRLQEWEGEVDVVTFRAVVLPAEDIDRVLAQGGRVVAYPGGDEGWSQELADLGFQQVAERRVGERSVVAWERVPRGTESA
ncbi:MAG: RsmG family class I SAM-dependent methyltransferase [Acidobacteriota bacterium]